MFNKRDVDLIARVLGGGFNKNLKPLQVLWNYDWEMLEFMVKTFFRRCTVRWGQVVIGGTGWNQNKIGGMSFEKLLIEYESFLIKKEEQ